MKSPESDRDATATALKTTERQLRTLLESFPDFLARFDREARLTYANPVSLRAFGVALEDILGATPRELFPPEPAGTREMLHEAVLRAVREGVSNAQEAIFMTGAGPRWVEIRHVPEKDETGNVVSVLGIGRDITEAKQAREALARSERLYRLVVDSMAEGLVLQGADGRITAVNPAALRITGRTAEELLALPAVTGLFAAVREDGSPFPLDEQPASVTLRTGEPQADVVVGFSRPDGERVWLSLNSAPLVRPGDPRPYGVVSTGHDITRRRRAEESLRQAQKMEAVGQLAGGIAHDFNNLLAVIQMQCALLEEEGEIGQDIRDGLQEIASAADRAAALTRQLLTFSRRDVTRPRSLDMAEVLTALMKLLRRVLGEHITLETHAAEPLPRIFADPGLMEQVILNLAINARDAMPDGGRLRISLQPDDVDATRAALHPGAGAGQHLCLSVTDTGTGIEPRHLGRIFEPFFTTKQVGQGTGLGLATVFGIVERHKGWLEVDSVVGRGTTFRVLVPAHVIEARPAEAAPISGKAPRGTETVLLVEDEGAVRNICRMVLQRQGYQVLESDCAAGALRRWDEKGGKIDLLLTDLIMPGGMSGRELAEILRARSPRLRVVYSSGYSNDIVDRMLPLAGHHFLQKPYSAADLAATVRRCLDGR